jgi:hypothetical protein
MQSGTPHLPFFCRVACILPCSFGSTHTLTVPLPLTAQKRGKSQSQLSVLRAHMQRLWKSYALPSQPACGINTVADDTARVTFHPLAGLWIIYGAAVALAFVATGIVVWIRERHAPDQNVAMRARAGMLSRQVLYQADDVAFCLSPFTAWCCTTSRAIQSKKRNPVPPSLESKRTSVARYRDLTRCAAQCDLVVSCN